MSYLTGFQLGMITAILMLMLAGAMGWLPKPDPIWNVVGRWASGS